MSHNTLLVEKAEMKLRESKEQIFIDRCILYQKNLEAQSLIIENDIAKKRNLVVEYNDYKKININSIEIESCVEEKMSNEY